MNKYTYEIWDKKSEINGVSPLVVMKAHGIKDNQVVGLIKNDLGAVTVLQYFPHEVSEKDMKKWLEEKTVEMNNPPVGEME